ncbi:MAG: hypothetical protein HDT19_05465 [Oscillibacter sp.]|nr:hypothetical protein [Oscillibacter sp.]
MAEAMDKDGCQGRLLSPAGSYRAEAVVFTQYSGFFLFRQWVSPFDVQKLFKWFSDMFKFCPVYCGQQVREQKKS